MKIFRLTSAFATACAVIVSTLSLLAPAPAVAGTFVGQTWTRNSTVTDVVQDQGNGTWTYAYTVNNTSTSVPTDGRSDPQPRLIDWELPWFGDAGITNILSPSGWGHSIETIGTANSLTGWGAGDVSWQTPGDLFYQGPASPFTTVNRVLHWYDLCVQTTACDAQDDGIDPGGSLSGFGFTADFDTTAAPYQASWVDLPVRSGDPANPLLGGVPGSPAALGLAVPEPGALGLVGAALLALVLSRRRRG